MRWTPVFLAVAAVVVAGCQRSPDDAQAEFTSGPAPQAASPPQEDGASEAEGAGSDASAEPAQQSAPPPSETGDMGDPRSSEESVEPESPTMFQ